MNLDFPLLLTWAVIITGVLSLLDWLWLRPARRKACAAYLQANSDAAADTDEQVQQLLKRPLLVEYAWSFFPVLALVLVLRSFLYEPYQIPSPSMQPNLEIGDFILVNKFNYGLRLPVLGTKVVATGAPVPGEVMVFIPPHENLYYIKRVIGVPGDTIRYQSKRLYINDELVPMVFVERITDAQGRIIRVYEEQLGGRNYRIYHGAGAGKDMQRTLGPDEYFMLGDNRDNSLDSREWGAVPEANIVGQAVAIWMHKPPGWHWPSFARNGGIN